MVDRPVSDIFLGTYPGLKLVREELIVNTDADSELGVDINANEYNGRLAGGTTRASFECVLAGSRKADPDLRELRRSKQLSSHDSDRGTPVGIRGRQFSAVYFPGGTLRQLS